MSTKRSYSNFLDSEEFPFTIDNNYKIRFPKLFSKVNIFYDTNYFNYIGKIQSNELNINIFTKI